MVRVMGKRQQRVRRQRETVRAVEAIVSPSRLPAGASKGTPLATPYDARLHAAIVAALDRATDNAPPSMLESGALSLDLNEWATEVIDELAQGWWPVPSP